MKNIRIAIVESDKTIINKLTDEIDAEQGMQLMAVSQNGREGMKIIKELEPDVVIIELLLAEMDGFAIIEEMKKDRRLRQKTRIILTSLLHNKEIVREAFNMGIDYFIIKPYDAKIILNRIKILCGDKQELDCNINMSYNIDSIIANTLIQMGIPASLKGYRYIATGIKEAAEDQKVLEGITKILYPSIAKKFDSTPQRVEKAIRHAIEVAWSKNNCNTLKERFNLNLSKGKHRPTNSEFIATMSQYIINSYK